MINSVNPCKTNDSFMLKESQDKVDSPKVDDSCKDKFVSTEAEYSKEGSNLANSTFNASVGIVNDYIVPKYSWPGARRVLRGGFEEIIKSPNTTKDEKTIANFGVKIGKEMSDLVAVRARATIMHTIASSMPGPLGSVIAKTAYLAAGQGTETLLNESRVILKEGFDEICKNPKSTNSQKSLAKIGLNIEKDKSLSDRDAAYSGLDLMNKISKQK